MARKSHRRCAGCGQARHSYAKFNLCQTCWQKRKPDHKQAWSEIKARRRARQFAHTEALALAEVPDITQLPPPGTPERIAVMRDIKAGTVRYHRPLNDEQEVEILDAYTRTDESIDSISSRFGVKNTYPYNVLNRAGVTWRRNDGISFDEWQARQQVKQEPVAIPKEPEVIVPEETRQLPPQIEAMRAIRPRSPSPAPVPEALQFEGEVWEVTFTGKMHVQATSARDAIEAAERDGHVTNIVGVNFRGRA